MECGPFLLVPYHFPWHSTRQCRETTALATRSRSGIVVTIARQAAIGIASVMVIAAARDMAIAVTTIRATTMRRLGGHFLSSEAPMPLVLRAATTMDTDVTTCSGALTATVPTTCAQTRGYPTAVTFAGAEAPTCKALPTFHLLAIVGQARRHSVPLHGLSCRALRRMHS